MESHDAEFADHGRTEVRAAKAGSARARLRAEIRSEVAAWLLTRQVPNPVGEAEEHVNDVLQGLARELAAGDIK